MYSDFTRRKFVINAGAAAALTLIPVGALGSETTKRRNTFSVSLNSYSYGQFDLAQCLEQIRKTPIRMLELPVEQARPNSLIPELMVEAPLGGEWQYSLSDLKQLLAKDGFQAESLDVFGFMGYQGSEPIIKRRIDFAERLGAKTIVLGCYHKAFDHKAKTSAGGESLEAKEARAYIYSMLRNVADYAAKKDIRIALEIHGGITANAAEALRTMNEVNRENLGINFDVANILIYNRDMDAAGAARELQSLAKHVFHVHLKDVVRLPGEEKPGEEKFVNPRLGQGEVDFRKAFDILHGVGFYGPFSFEIETFQSDTTSNDIRAYQQDMEASIEYLRSLGEFDL